MQLLLYWLTICSHLSVWYWGSNWIPQLCINTLSAVSGDFTVTVLAFGNIMQFFKYMKLFLYQYSKRQDMYISVCVWMYTIHFDWYLSWLVPWNPNFWLQLWDWNNNWLEQVLKTWIFPICIDLTQNGCGCIISWPYIYNLSELPKLIFRCHPKKARVCMVMQSQILGLVIIFQCDQSDFNTRCI